MARPFIQQIQRVFIGALDLNMNCETSYTDCCHIEVIEPHHNSKLKLNTLTHYLRKLVIVGAEDMSKIK